MQPFLQWLLQLREDVVEAGRDDYADAITTLHSQLQNFDLTPKQFSTAVGNVNRWHAKFKSEGIALTEGPFKGVGGSEGSAVVPILLGLGALFFLMKSR